MQWTRFRLWLANRLLPSGYVAYPTDLVEDHLSILRAQQAFYRLIEQHPHLAVTKTLLAPESRAIN